MDDDRQHEISTFDSMAMLRAVALAYQGQGYVEPNPMVGCTVAKNGVIVADGFHERFGGPHAEHQALSQLSPHEVRGSTIYITLEPCTHFGKTPPCVDLIVKLQPQRVVVGLQDPFPAVAGSGIRHLRSHGIQVDLGIERQACQNLVAPYLKRQSIGLPWIIGKWAMTLDGRMATFTGDSKWITTETTRQHAHTTRGRVDAICVGIGTALSDDPMLTARPSGPRVAVRVVMDSQAKLPLTSNLVRSAHEFPTLICCGPDALKDNIVRLQSNGCEVLQDSTISVQERTKNMLEELSRRGHTNVLIDGGPRFLGHLFDQQQIDEVHIYLGNKLVGGKPIHVPNASQGIQWMNDAVLLKDVRRDEIGNDTFIRATCSYQAVNRFEKSASP